MTVDPLSMLPPPLPLATEGQALLFSREIEGLLNAEERQGRYTAERLKQLEPDKYHIVVHLLGKGWGQLEIARTCRVHHMTVGRVAEQEPEAIDVLRRRQINRIETAGHLQIERLIEHPGLVPFNIAALAAKQLLELAEVMNGRASSRVEHVERIDIHSGWDEFVANQLLPDEEPKQLGSGEVREIGAASDMGFGGGNLSALEDSAARDGSTGTPGSEADGDMQSPVSHRQTGSDTDSAADSDRDSAGVGGDGHPAGGGLYFDRVAEPNTH